MPLLDHFRPPVRLGSQWQSFAATWLTGIADRLEQTYTEACRRRRLI